MSTITECFVQKMYVSKIVDSSVSKYEDFLWEHCETRNFQEITSGIWKVIWNFNHQNFWIKHRNALINMKHKSIIWSKNLDVKSKWEEHNFRGARINIFRKDR